MGGLNTTPRRVVYHISYAVVHRVKEPIKYVKVQNINSASIVNLKNSVGNSDLFPQFNLSLNSNSNDNYNILSSILEQEKNTFLKEFKDLIDVRIY